MSKEQDKLTANLQRLLGTQNFKTIEEANEFMAQFIGQQIPSFPKEALNFKEQAQDLVFAAYEMDLDDGILNVEQALILDPDCIEAFEYLAATEHLPVIASAFYEKGISIGRRLYGGAYLAKNKGYFWGLVETRPFMRCLHQYAIILHFLGRVAESVAVLEEMIALNPNDNQGVRDQLLLFLIELNDRKKFVKYDKMYKEDYSAFFAYNRALFAFKTEGDGPNAVRLLKLALLANKYVPRRLLSDKPVVTKADYYSPGDAKEADYYGGYAQAVWAKTPGARDWLRQHSAK